MGPAVLCDGVRWDGITTVWKCKLQQLFSPEDDCHQRYVHSLILTQPLCLIKKNLTPLSATPSLLFSSSLFPLSHLFTHTHAHLQPIQHIQATAVWLFIWQRGWIKLARLPRRDGSVSGWWLRSPAASLPRAGNSNLIRARTPPSPHLPESSTGLRPKQE